jgi:D-beta-D-heptose 7-phosphate kinase/D-beta-D-heptose 1-phosphate adenosyltransferase
MIADTVLLDRLESLGRPRLLIVGDLILDRYVTGDVLRISPEAPIPVLSARSSEPRLGGAGNVAANLRAMKADVRIIGVVGDDAPGLGLQEMLGEKGVDLTGLVVDAGRPTTEKARMLSGVQQMLRVDWEETRPLDEPIVEQLLAPLAEAVAWAEAVVLSDYGKGVLARPVLERAIALARERGIPVLVDPKGGDYSIYRGATLVTPNRKEAELALGRRIERIEELPAAADELIQAADLDRIVITLGSDGIYYRTRRGEEARAPAQARAVFDVTGAGDTVVAHLALYLAGGLDMETAIGLANHAAGLVVARLGTYSVTRPELAVRLSEDQSTVGKVLDESSLGPTLERWRKDKRRIVFTNGCFDVVHAGHIEYLQFARSKGDVLIVAVNDDESVRRLKGPERPVNPLKDREFVLSAFEMVDAVVAFAEDTPQRLIEWITPNVLVKGEDYKDKGVVGREWVERNGGQVVLAPLKPWRSTTGILERARSGQGIQRGGA